MRNGKLKEKMLTVNGLAVTFGSEVVLNNLSFNVERGENLVIIGPNGSGKTVLLRTLVGSVPYKGEILFAPDAVIGYVPQKLDIDRDFPLSLKDFLLSKESFHDNHNSHRHYFYHSHGHHHRTRIKEAMELVRLQPSLLNKTIGYLSGGQFQRALIAFALLGNPNLLLFDEPTVSVDLTSEEQIYETLHRLQKEKNITLITVSHDLQMVYGHADTVLCLNKTKLCFGVPREVLNPGVLAELYGGQTKFYEHDHKH